MKVKVNCRRGNWEVDGTWVTDPSESTGPINVSFFLIGDISKVLSNISISLSISLLFFKITCILQVLLV